MFYTHICQVLKINSPNLWEINISLISNLNQILYQFGAIFSVAYFNLLKAPKFNVLIIFSLIFLYSNLIHLFLRTSWRSHFRFATEDSRNFVTCNNICGPTQVRGFSIVEVDSMNILGEKPYKCSHQGCGKVHECFSTRTADGALLQAFTQLSNLQSHSRSHMTDKPYRCNSCYKCFADEQGLREHIPKHSETKHIKTHICHICGKNLIPPPPVPPRPRYWVTDRFRQQKQYIKCNYSQ